MAMAWGIIVLHALLLFTFHMLCIKTFKSKGEDGYEVPLPSFEVRF